MRRKELYGDESHEPLEDEENDKRVKRAKGSKGDPVLTLSGDDEPSNSKQGSKRMGKPKRSRTLKNKDPPIELIEVADDNKEADRRIAEVEEQNALLLQELLNLKDQLAQINSQAR